MYMSTYMYMHIIVAWHMYMYMFTYKHVIVAGPMYMSTFMHNTVTSLCVLVPGACDITCTATTFFYISVLQCIFG